MLCATNVSANSSTVESGIVGEVSTRKSTGESAGLNLLNDGGAGMFCGRLRLAWVMAAWTSCAAPSILRLRTNCRVLLVRPRRFWEDIESEPGIVEDRFASRRDTALANVSG